MGIYSKYPNSLRNISESYNRIPENICVSSFGRVYDYNTKTFFPTYLRKDGYLGIFGMMALHRIILYTFNPINNFINMTVDHINLNTTDNCLWNLRWMSMHDNIRRSIDSGNRTNIYFKKGQDNIHSTITDYQVELCCRALNTHKYSYIQIAQALNMTVRQVKHIKEYDSHQDICEKYNLQNNSFDYRHLKKNTEFILPLLEEIQE